MWTSSAIGLQSPDSGSCATTSAPVAAASPQVCQHSPDVNALASSFWPGLACICIRRNYAWSIIICSAHVAMCHSKPSRVETPPGKKWAKTSSTDNCSQCFSWQVVHDFVTSQLMRLCRAEFHRDRSSSSSSSSLSTHSMQIMSDNTLTSHWAPCHTK